MSAENVERLGYPIPEVAQALGVSRETVRTWLKFDRIPRFKIGKRVLIPAWWLEDRLRDAEKATPAEPDPESPEEG